MALEKKTTNQYVGLLKEMEEQMLAINQLIDYAEDTDTANLGLKQWLDNLKEVVYDAEDVRDVIATQTHENEVSSSTPWNPFKRSLRRTPWNPFKRPLRRTPWNPFKRSIHQELEDVLCRMKRLLKQQKFFGLRPSTRSEALSRRPTSSLVDQSGVYGRDDDKEKIKKLLLSDNDGSNVSVIAIVGMGGLGKTTLAQLLFNHYQIDSVFQSNKLWICVEKDFDVEKITKTILQKLTKESCHTKDFDQVQHELKELITGKKFLMVLDDVWNENSTNWDDLQKPFGFVAQGSKIIVTTRSERVASIMRATSTYKLDRLSDEACWKLFSKHAFENIHLNDYSIFEANVVKKCGGLPLAAKVLGGLLHGLGCQEWGEILRSNIWDEKGEVLPVLRLSYHYLPSNLKRCFAFCSIVPKDFDFETQKLVLLWMAENLLQDSKGNKKRIDVGYEYLRELESRSLIQPTSDDERLGELYFSMHDLVNDLAKSVSGEFYKGFDLGKSFNAGEKTRHFSYDARRFKGFIEDPTRFKWVNKAKRLRTFLPVFDRFGISYNVTLPPQLRSEIWQQLNVLRSLTLAWARIVNLPDSIGNLKLLRYLDLSHNRFTQLPESVASLFNLEVLNLSACSFLTKLPSKMTQLIKLNYLNIRNSCLLEMPLEMGRLKDLDVLTDFVLGEDSGSSIGELKGLKDLRGGLRICGLQNITNPEHALVADLKGKSKLEELTLEWWYIDSANNLEDATIILENLEPPVKLKKLSIWRYPGTRLPDWSGQNSFANLASIEIHCFRWCDDLSPLGQLPSLKTLNIWHCYSRVTLVPTEISAGYFSALVDLGIFYCPWLELPQHHCFTSIENVALHEERHFSSVEINCPKLELPQRRHFFPNKVFPLSSFLKLKELRLEGLQSIESLGVIDEANNLNLGTLSIKDCKKFIANRSSWGLQRLLSLSVLGICDFECDDLESFPEEGLLPSSLSTLEIDTVPNLRSLNGKSFQLLTSLETLVLRRCPKL